MLAVFILSSFLLSSAEEPLRITLSSYSVKDVAREETATTRSLGIPNAAVGEKVYLNADGGGEHRAELAWNLTPPPGSSARLSTETGSRTTLVPDVVGQYEVTVRVPNSEQPATLWVNAGRYVGSGGVVDTGNGAQCINCHDEMVAGWLKTGHASIFERGLNGLLDRYDESCLECHAVGFREDIKATAWLSAMEQKGWSVSENVHEGSFKELIEAHPEIANLANVQCESCHGPGSEHVGSVDKNQIHVSLSSESCAYCHEFSSKTSVYSQYLSSAHAHSMDTPEERVEMNRTECTRCHSAQGFWQEVIRGKESAAPYKDLVGLVCATCHDAHAGEGKAFMLWAGDVGKACVGCHDQITRNDADGFSGCPQARMVKGAGQGAHALLEKGCAECHMAKVSDLTLADTVGGHTFKVSSGDSKIVMNTTACDSCHETMSVEWMRQSQEKTRDLLDRLASLLPKRDDEKKPKFPADPSLSEDESRTSYNYYLISSDGSMGVHNPVYIRSLLEESIATLEQAR